MLNMDIESIINKESEIPDIRKYLDNDNILENEYLSEFKKIQKLSNYNIGKNIINEKRDDKGKCQVCGILRDWDDDGKPCPKCKHDHIIYLKDKTLNESIDKNNYKPVYILLTYTDTIMAKLIKRFTSDPYSHSSISLDSSLRNMYSFGRFDSTSMVSFTREDIRRGLFKKLEDKTYYSLYVTFVNEIEYEKILYRLDDFIRNANKMKYNFKGLFANLFKIEYENDFAYFCSEFISELLNTANSDILCKHRSQIAPYDFAKNKKFHFVTKGILKNYNQDRIEDKVDNILKDINSNS